MEPFSAFVLASMLASAAPLATRRPHLELEPSTRKSRALTHKPTEFVILDQALANHSLPSLSIIETSYAGSEASPKNLLKLEVASYETSPDVLEAAVRLVDLIPSRLTLPRPMISSSGEVAFYWDLPQGYAEISFDPESGSLVFFSRNDTGQERFDDSVRLESLGPEWFWHEIGPLEAQEKQAA